VKIKQTFTKAERLCSIKVIESLFVTGKVFHYSFFKVVWAESATELPFPAQVAFSVPKRNIRLAVVRNLAKRRMREAYRKNKHLLYSHLSAAGKQIVFAVILRVNTVPEYDAIENAMNGVISKLMNLTPAGNEKC
jgi:ribonuclease P protein component